jgi:WS/DGAT/MGAT family acyltransferase
MDRLSGLDASFLYLETSSQLLHVCALVTLDGSTVPGGYSFPKFKEQLDERIAVIPAFRRKLHNPPLNLTHPLWIEDENFDLDQHLHRIGVPAPGDRHEVAELCAHIAGQPLDRGRPLWEMYVIEGLADGSLVLMLKMHHSSVDGVGGANLITHLAGLEPDSPPPDPAENPRNPGVPNPLTALRNSVTSLIGRPVEVAKLLPGLAGMVPGWLGRSLRGKGMPVPFTAPRTSFNGTITGHRSVAYAEFDLDDVKRVKNAFGVTVNDVVLTICAGALRTFLEERGELPPDPLVATVPVSVHERSERSQGNNRISAFFAGLPTHLADPSAQLFAIAENNRLAKAHHRSIDADMLQDWAQFAAPTLFALGVRAYSMLRLAEKHPVVHNLVISNVPGPPMPL